MSEPDGALWSDGSRLVVAPYLFRISPAIELLKPADALMR